MKKYIVFLFFISIIILGNNIANQAEAQGPPINTETAFVTGFESGAVRSFGKATREIGSLPGGRGELNIISIPLIVPYELLPNRLVVGASIPYLDKEKKTTILPVVYETYPAKHLNLYLEFNGKLSQRNKQNDKRVNDSGRNTIFLSPGIQFIPARNFLIEASFQKPIYEDLRGNQLDTDYSFNIGFRWLLF